MKQLSEIFRINRRYLLSTCLFILACKWTVYCQSDTSNAAVNDILNGKGFFNNSNTFETWKEPEEGLEVELVVGTDETFIKVTKGEDEELGFSDGFELNFNYTMPEHLRFYYSATNVETEQANLRLKDGENDLTAVSFRCGNAGFIRVNDNQMVDFYNFSLSDRATYTPTWSKIDVIMDWSAKTISVYLNDSFISVNEFYHTTIQEVDSIMIYNLEPGTISFFKDIELCQGYCENFNDTKRLTFISLLLFLIMLICF